jgi:hypothetical protein
MITALNLDRLAECANDETPAWRERFERDREVLRHSLAIGNDAELLTSLANCGIELDRETLGQWTSVAGSAEEIARALKVQGRFRSGWTARDHAVVWAIITILWQRWCSESPNFEMLNDLIGDGIEAEAEDRCEIWLAAWRLLVLLADKLRLDTVRAFDERFHGTELLQNWVQDLEMELGDLARPGHKRDWFRKRAEYCQAFLTRFPREDAEIIRNMRRAWAESLHGIGETQRSNGLFEQWLKDEPLWAWGWIGWADTHLYESAVPRDLNRAEEILHQGLGVEGIQEQDVFYERLEYLYDQQGRSGKALEMRTIAKKLKSSSAHLSSKPGHQPFKRLEPKVGRNDPCPCGSGKKFKKCCGS